MCDISSELRCILSSNKVAAYAFTDLSSGRRKEHAKEHSLQPSRITASYVLLLQHLWLWFANKLPTQVGYSFKVTALRLGRTDLGCHCAHKIVEEQVLACDRKGQKPVQEAPAHKSTFSLYPPNSHNTIAGQCSYLESLRGLARTYHNRSDSPDISHVLAGNGRLHSGGILSNSVRPWYGSTHAHHVHAISQRCVQCNHCTGQLDSEN